MTSLDRVNRTVAAAGVGLCAAALALSPTAAAGGYECVETSAGAAPGAAAAAPCAPLAAPVNEMAGVPMALPGPVPVVPVAPVPLGAPVPVGAPVPIAPVAAPVPVAAPLPVGAPLVEMAGTGKGDFVGPPAPGAPAPGQPILPGPTG